jgi:eukaryotic-like serine/threonine-protein kinase
MSTQVMDIAPPAALTALHPVELADLMLLELIAREHGTLSLEPRGGHHALVLDAAGTRTTLARAPTAVAEAAIARLAIVGGVFVAPGQAVRFRVMRQSHRGIPGAGSSEVLLSVRAAAGGLCAELHALAAAPRSMSVLGLGGDQLETDARYRIIEEVGRGGMGIVYRAQHLSLQKEVALKVLAPALANSPMMVAQFMVEARAACRARHPNIVDVTDFGQLTDGRHFLVMELVPWPTLDTRLAQGPLAVNEAVAGIASGLHAAHAQGVVHRDLKPSNVFVNADNEVKLGDFGLALTVSGEGAVLSEQMMGTPAYMAPEQAHVRPADHRSDLYALGCMLFEMLSGAPPFPGAELVHVLLHHERDPVPALPEHVPTELAALVHHLLAKSPEGRPASADVVVTTLRRLGDSRSGWQRLVQP